MSWLAIPADRAVTCPVDGVNPSIAGQVRWQGGQPQALELVCRLQHRWEVPVPALELDTDDVQAVRLALRTLAPLAPLLDTALLPAIIQRLNTLTRIVNALLQMIQER